MNPPKPTSFTWDRERLYEKDYVTACFNMSKALSNGQVTIKKVKKDRKTKTKPLPLTTVKMQKIGTSKLRMNSHQIMSIAEKLYTKGYISYPRTETDQFEKSIDLKRLVSNLIDFPDQGARDFIRNMTDGEGFEQPRKGNNNDNAHPPIHPVKLPQGLTPEEFKVYNLVARHFLACCSKDAVGEQTRIEAEVGGEYFHTSGIVVAEKNYLQIYEPFEFWGGVELPKFQEGEVLTPSDYSVRQGKTTPPQLLTEADLIGMMEKHNIGTDSTIHEHIKTIQDRNYAFKQGQVFKPSNLGVSLVECYNSLGIDLAKPRLRAEMEKDMDKIAKGTITKAQVIEKYQSQMSTIYIEVESKKAQLVESLAKYISKNSNLNGERADPEEGNDDDEDNYNDFPSNQGTARSLQPHADRQHRAATANESVPRVQGKRIGPCTKCGDGSVVVRATKTGGYFLSCTAYPKCQTSASLPQKIASAEMTEVKCASCSKALHDNIFKVKLTFEDKSLKSGNYCLLCSDKLVGYKYELKTKPGEGAARPSNEPATTNQSNEPRAFEGRPAQPTCFKCNQVGHYANNCTAPRDEGSMNNQFPQGPSIKKPTITCSICGKNGHLAHQCKVSKDNNAQKNKNGGGSFTDIDDRSVPPPTRTCYKCGQPGHYANACPSKTIDGPKGFENKEKSGENVCFKCQKTGHWARDCPNK